MKTYVEMGAYYNVNPYGLVRTVCKAYDHESGESMIAFVHIDKGGYAGDIFLMSEAQFKNIFLS